MAPETYLEAELAERIAKVLWRLKRIDPYETAVIAASRQQGDEEFKKQLRKSLHLQDDDWFKKIKKNEALLRAVGVLAEHLNAHKPDDVPVAADVALAFLEIAAQRATIALDTVELPGMPTGDFERVVACWTVQHVRDGVSAIATHAKLDPADLMLCTCVEGQLAARVVPTIREELAPVILQDERNQVVRAHALPDADTLDRLVRYEAHLHRILLQLLHELEALKAQRCGERTYLARVDVQGLPEQ